MRRDGAWDLDATTVPTQEVETGGAWPTGHILSAAEPTALIGSLLRRIPGAVGCRRVCKQQNTSTRTRGGGEPTATPLISGE